MAITNAGTDLTYEPDADYCNSQSGTTPDMASGRSRFVVGAARWLRVGFSLDATPTSTAPPRPAATTVFTSGRINPSGLPQLRQGIYLLGLNDGAWLNPVSLPSVDDPTWSKMASIVVSVEAV